MRCSAFEASKADRHGSNDDRRGGESAEILARTMRELDGVRAENAVLKERGGRGSKRMGRTRETSAQSLLPDRRGNSGGSGGDLEDEDKEKEGGGGGGGKVCGALVLPSALLCWLVTEVRLYGR